ncbi:MAG: cobaltochelatase subunit CobN [Candidatus Methanoplasma sp.]|jgi:cobaltochelatase CobN|nr:cobaltochelatase subunit CobN [Candidatus Methanoplasma sp.]
MHARESPADGPKRPRAGRSGVLVAVVSVYTGDHRAFDAPAGELRAEGFDIEVECADSADLDADAVVFSEFLDRVGSADLIMIRVHGDVTYFKRFDALRKAVDRAGTVAFLSCTEKWVMDEYRYMFRDADGYDLLARLSFLGGGANNKNILKWGLRTFAGADVEVSGPAAPVSQGAYHPDTGTTDIAERIDALDRSKPTVAVFFYQELHRSGNMKHIDGLIRALERKGANPLALFFRTCADDVPGAMGLQEIVDRHLLNGPVAVDCVIETMGFSQTLTANPGCGNQVADRDFFERLDVPILQSMVVSDTEEHWKDGASGLSAMEIVSNAVHPEFDGQIITVPCASTEIDVDGGRWHSPIAGRVDDIAETAVRWARLRRKKNADKRVAILLYMYPPRTDLAGGASGLDTFQSAADMLKAMKDLGYSVEWVPENGGELTERLLAGITNDTSWLSDAEVSERALDLMSVEKYAEHTGDVPDAAKSRITDGWGPPPGDVHTTGGRMHIPGILNGNVLISFQPDRGRSLQSSYHDVNCVMPHQYLAYYRWLRSEFCADAVVHLGTHGTLEWLPGKSVGLSADCCPDYVLGRMPNVYPYIIGNPGEGIQAKRRCAAAVVDHMIPAMRRAGSYDDLEELESVLQAYMGAESAMQGENMSLIGDRLYGAVSKMSLFSDAGLPEDASAADVCGKAGMLYDYVLELKNAMIKDGMHILGSVPEGERLEETIYSLTRHRNDGTPSLRASVAKSMGLDLDGLLKNPSGTDASTGMLNGRLADGVESKVSDLISRFASLGFDRSGCERAARELFPNDNGDLTEVVGFICGELHPNILRTSDEMRNVMHGLDGGHIPPGPSGCPTRGRARILPTGRNLYSIDPGGIPWHSSWEIGSRMADQMVERYVKDNGQYPKDVGIVVWATDVMKTGGDDISYILRLMGLRPVWTGYGGRVTGLEVIPISELGRPRIDVTVRISGLFRDAFPNLVDLLDDAVNTVSGLDESEEDNYLKANLRAEIARYLKENMSPDDARAAAMIRIFGDAPGTYGAGVDVLIETSRWDDLGDLGDIYRTYGCYAYGRGRRGESAPEQFRTRLSKAMVTVKNNVSRELDMFDHDDTYLYLGGMNAAVRALGGDPTSFMGDSSDTDNTKLRTVEEEGRYIFRSKILNPKWLEGLKRHGFKGAQEISEMFEFVFAWDATSDVIEDWMYESMTESYVFDKETREWIENVNPYAMREMVSRLMEAVGREMWDPSEEVMEKLSDIYLSNEERLENANEGRT